MTTAQDSRSPIRWGVMGGASFVANVAVIPAIIAEARSVIAVFASLSHPGKLPLDELGARRVDDYQDLIDKSLVDALYIATPNSMHAQWAIAAMREGISVLCEKPIAISTAEIDELAHLADKTGALVMEAYMTAFSMRDLELRRIANSGRIGELQDIKAAFTFTLSDTRNYRWNPELGGGALTDVGIYLLDPIIDLLGMPDGIEIETIDIKSGVVAGLVANLDYDSGAHAEISCSFEAPEEQSLRITGSDGVLSVEHAFTPSPLDTAITLITPIGSETIFSPSNDPYSAMVKSFVDSHLDGSSPPRPIARSRQVISVVEEILGRRAASG